MQAPDSDARDTTCNLGYGPYPSKTAWDDDDWWEYAKQWLRDNGVDETVL